MNIGSALYTGKVTHQRLRPARHRLTYGVFSLLVDLDELPALDQRLKWFSINRFNVFSLHERDYGDGKARRLRSYVSAQLAAAGLPEPGAIRLLSMPRILGYAFNPLSVYFCHDRNNVLNAILYEVNNTFGERHSYLIEVERPQADGDSGADGAITQRCAKRFHVSPFLDTSMAYRFRVEPPSQRRSGLSIGITASDDEGPVLVARFEASRNPLTDSTLMHTLLSHPLLTLKVVAGIHWEALRLLIKGVGIHSRPAPPLHPVTFVKAIDS